jgi:hypothetical protein
MRSAFRLAMLVPALLLLPPLAAQNDTKKSTYDEDVVRTKLVGSTYIDGKLTVVEAEGEEPHFTVQYVHQIKTANKEGQKKLAEVTRAYNDAVRRRDQNTAKRLYEEGQAAVMAAWDVQEYPITFDLKADKNLSVRTNVIPLGDDGKPKKLSAEEQKKAKGPDPKLPGLTASIKDLDVEQRVRFYIDKDKFKPAKKDDKKDKDKAKEKDKDADKTTEKPEGEKSVYPISMIVILPNPSDAVGGGGGAANPFFKK